MKINFIILSFVVVHFALSQELDVVHVPIGINSEPANAPVKLELIHRKQMYNTRPDSAADVYDGRVHSPKSAIFNALSHKLYINALEGYVTLVYNDSTFKFINRIDHKFQADDSSLFNNESTVFDYKYAYRKDSFNIFSGKPVESCLSHNGKYLWVTYYRRSYDANAISPSAVAIIDTETDKIVRVMPSGPLPKMIAASPDNKYIAVTHWGDNTIGIIDIQSDTVSQFRYIKQFIVGYKQTFDFEPGEKIDRDNDCGYCLRGTVFTPDNKYLLVSRMGGGGIAIFDMVNLKYLGTVFGMKSNLRHIVINNDDIYISSNLTGFVQKAKLQDVIENKLKNPGKDTQFTDWQSCYTGGVGARTICVSSDGRYIFVAVNNDSKIAVIDSQTMRLISNISCDSYPVGMALSHNDRTLVVTSQGKRGQGGHSVMMFNIEYVDK
ncbi:MAG: beta-propeller fold lactonase family protein [Calditrichaceae bacterium]|nr:beta-propeller fold lactonase family protein [Calditrichaceae bacterium]HES59624.1 peptidoglycan-binding protein [Caldithrix sp.]